MLGFSQILRLSLGWWVCNKRRRWNDPYSTPLSVLAAISRCWLLPDPTVFTRNPSSPSFFISSGLVNEATRLFPCGVPATRLPATGEFFATTGNSLLLSL